MNLAKRVKRLLLAVAVATFAPVALAQLQAGKDYQLMPTPQNTDAPGKIEVIEFFWYGCPHCYHLEPAINSWIKKLPKDVAFRRVPAMFNENWAQAGRVFYTLEAIGDLERVHGALFDAIHKDNLRITNKSALDEFLKKQNIDVAKYDAALKSFAVESKVRRAMQLTEAYSAKVDGVPAIVVGGKYVALLSISQRPDKLLETTDHLIGLARTGK